MKAGKQKKGIRIIHFLCSSCGEVIEYDIQHSKEGDKKEYVKGELCQECAK